MVRRKVPQEAGGGGREGAKWTDDWIDGERERESVREREREQEQKRERERERENLRKR